MVLQNHAVVDRAKGALLGLAVGDALGTTLEFSGRNTHACHTEMTGGGPFDLKPGEWTDDTAMALGLADSLLACGGFDPHDLMTRFLAWWRAGTYSCTGECFDIGMTTARALSRFERTGEPFSGSTTEDEAGNGSLMRLAPAVLFALHDPEEVQRIAGEQGRTTHGAPQAVDACRYFAILLRAVILGERDPLRSLHRRLPAGQPLHPAIAAVAGGSFRDKPRDAIRSTGYVVDTLEAALWCISQTKSFEEALVLAVNLAGDADTVGAVTGQLAGAIYGASAIPQRWLQRLAYRGKIDGVAVQLMHRAASEFRQSPLSFLPTA